MKTYYDNESIQLTYTEHPIYIQFSGKGEKIVVAHKGWFIFIKGKFLYLFPYVVGAIVAVVVIVCFCFVCSFFVKVVVSSYYQVKNYYTKPPEKCDSCNKEKSDGK